MPRETDTSMPSFELQPIDPVMAGQRDGSCYVYESTMLNRDGFRVVFMHNDQKIGVNYWPDEPAVIRSGERVVKKL